MREGVETGSTETALDVPHDGHVQSGAAQEHHRFRPRTPLAQGRLLWRKLSPALGLGPIQQDHVKLLGLGGVETNTRCDLDPAHVCAEKRFEVRGTRRGCIADVEYFKSRSSTAGQSWTNSIARMNETIPFILRCWTLTCLRSAASFILSLASPTVGIELLSLYLNAPSSTGWLLARSVCAPGHSGPGAQAAATVEPNDQPQPPHFSATSLSRRRSRGSLSWQNKPRRSPAAT